MQFIQSKDAKNGTQEMAKKIYSGLNGGCQTLWLVCGGSNIPFAVEAMNIIRKNTSLDALKHLTVTLTDERYGLVGHKDSNWQRLLDSSFDIQGIKTFPVLSGKSLEETAMEYGTKMSKVFDDIIHVKGSIIAQFGIGTNSHIAGVYPHSVSVDSDRFVTGYDSGDFLRVTLDTIALRQIHCAYVFAFGEAKKEPLLKLRDQNLSIKEDPSQLLKEIPEVYIYSDQV